MGYYNPALLQPELAGNTNNTPGGITGLLSDRNFLSLLAGIGQGLDPKGVGGAIGGPTRLAIASQAAQERAAQNASAQNAHTKLLIDALNRYGGIGDKETPGVTSAKATPEGVQLEITPKTGDVQGPVQQAPAVAPTQPAPVVAPVVTPGTPPVGPTTLPQTSTTRQRVSELLPFYSALLEQHRAPWQG